MSMLRSVLATAVVMAVSTAAQADGRAAKVRTIELGGLTGVTYYTPEADGYRVVFTLARHEAVPAVRFETTLVSGQEAVVSIPHELGLEAQAVRISRSGNEIVVRQTVRKTASAE